MNKIKENWKNIKRVLRVINKIDRHYFHWVMVTHAINALVPCMLLYLSSYVLDGMADGKSFRQLVVTVSLILGMALVLNFVASTVWNRCEVRRDYIYNMYESMREEKVIHMDYSRVDSPEVRRLKEQMERDRNWGWGINTPILCINDILYQICSGVAALVLTWPVLVYMIHHITGWMTLVFLVMTGLILLLCKVRIPWTKKMEDYKQLRMKDKDVAESVHFLWSNVTGGWFNYQNVKDIKIYQGFDLMRRWNLEAAFSKSNQKRLEDMAKTRGMDEALRTAVFSLLEPGAYILVTMMTMAGKLTVGNLVAFAGGMTRLFNGVLGCVVSAIELTYRVKQQCSTLDYLELEKQMYDGTIPVEKRSDNEYQIEFRHVYFKYPGSEEYALKDLCLTLTIGEKMAVVGMNGSGKTTMIKLLCRLYDVTEGEILLNGVNIKKYDQREYRQLFSVVFQDFHILPYTLGENVAASGETDPERVMECLEKAGLGERVRNLPEGLQTFVTKQYDENGVEFSGGELQKTAIARAIYKESPFVLLDEPTAALDPMAEYEIYRNFDKIVDKKTAIYISHRLSSCRFCKKIAVFHEGRLIQMGSHEQLLQDTDGKYYEMWKAQAKYYQ